VSHTKPGRLRNDGFLVLGTGLLECIGLVEVLGSRKLGREVIADSKRAES
jgi:hypothetical protein